MSDKDSESGTMGLVLRKCIGPFLILTVAIYLQSCLPYRSVPYGAARARLWPKLILILLRDSVRDQFGEIIWEPAQLG